MVTENGFSFNRKESLVILKHGDLMENLEDLWEEKFKVLCLQWKLKGGLGQLTTIFVVLILQNQEYF